ncbi:MAG: sugar ABC transporter permease [Clostridiaceae bacterium]|nr:sugar ABC transporter permease [Clostridiaceae bacterium]
MKTCNIDNTNDNTNKIAFLPPKTRNGRSNLLKRILKSYQLYILLIPTLLYIIIFHYGPMYGVLIAFKDFKAHLGIMGSPWAGFKHFERFFRSPRFWELIRNTLSISLYSLAAGFPIPIIFALGMNSLNSQKFKKILQTVTYAPHFISTVVIVGMMSVFLSPTTGIVNSFIKKLGGEPIFFMSKPELFSSLYVWSGVWQNMGWSSIIYLAALSSIDPGLHEAAIIDGASKIKRIQHIDIPGILSTVIILLIMNAGRIMSVGFEKVFLIQNPLNTSTSEVIATYVYKRGLIDAQYSFSTAVGLFNSIVNMILLVIVNQISRRIGETSLW